MYVICIVAETRSVLRMTRMICCSRLGRGRIHGMQYSIRQFSYALMIQVDSKSIKRQIQPLRLIVEGCVGDTLEWSNVLDAPAAFHEGTLAASTGREETAFDVTCPV